MRHSALYSDGGLNKDKRFDVKIVLLTSLSSYYRAACKKHGKENMISVNYQMPITSEYTVEILSRPCLGCGTV